MAIEGRLSAGGVADLLGALWHSERTGLLDLAAGGADRKLALKDGAVVYVVSTDPAEKLAVRLVTSGAATREQLIKASRAGGDLRKQLQAAGADPAAYDRTMQELITEVIAKVFALTEGHWTVHDRDELGLDGVLEDLDMTPVLWRAARACPADFAAKFLGQPGARVLKTGNDELLQELPDLSPQEGFLLSRLDGYCSTSDLLGVLPLPEEQVLRLLVGLVLIGYAEVQGRPGVKLPRPARTTGKRKKASAPEKPKTAGGTRATLVSPAGSILPAAAPAAEPEAELGGLDAARTLRAKIRELDFYGVLSLKIDADDDDIRKSYYRLARAYHPDRFGKELAGPDREMVEDLFARVSDAFSTLSNPEKRKDYDERLKSGALQAEKEKAKAVEPRELARISHEKGKTLLGQGDRGRALSFFEHAAETDPDNWDYRMSLARILMGESRLRKRAEQQLQEAIRIDQTKADAYLLLGMIYKLAGVKSRALEQFQQGLRWDAGHAGIRKEMAELGEKGEEDAAGGLLGGLFKKK